MAVYSRSNLIGVTYIHLSLTHSLTHPLTRNILDAPTKRYFFVKKNNSKMGHTCKNGSHLLKWVSPVRMGHT